MVFGGSSLLTSVGMAGVSSRLMIFGCIGLFSYMVRGEVEQGMAGGAFAKCLGRGCLRNVAWGGGSEYTVDCRIVECRILNKLPTQTHTHSKSTPSK